jgi:uncharacterized 2Fe-2S/4Fe-4S cluster protein (DUF4445 family)
VKPVVHIRLHPQGTTIEVEQGTPLHDILFSYGVEFPCGGRGRCTGCRVRVLEGDLPVTPEQERMLTPEERNAGWRLACQCRADRDMTLELAQWEASILTDTTQFSITPRDGLGIAVDVGTTTLVAQLLDLRTGTVLAVRTGLNAQARFGSDIMSRVSYAVVDRGQAILVRAIRNQIGKMINELLKAAGREAGLLREVILVGNTVMHHLVADISLEPLASYPFESPALGEQRLLREELGWDLPSNAAIRFLPCIAGYVGSDILAGLFAKEMHLAEETVMLVDLGTNGEIVIGNRNRLVCCSTAAGPAFEGARIFMGMRASTGAIAEVELSGGKTRCHVLGNVPPRGVCGSGLVDAVAAWLDLGLVGSNGRLKGGEGFLDLCPPVRISQTDIRELQLAKGAIAAGIEILLEQLGVTRDDVSTVHLAGAFGNYINTTSAGRIGMIPFPTDRVQPAGNTALLGAKMALFTDEAFFSTLARSIEHVPLHAHRRFQEIYVEEMSFPS